MANNYKTDIYLSANRLVRRVHLYLYLLLFVLFWKFFGVCFRVVQQNMMPSRQSLAEQARSLIDSLNARQTVISNQIKTMTNDTPGILKKSKSVTFIDNEQSDSKVRIHLEICVIRNVVNFSSGTIRSNATIFDFKTIR